MTSLDLYNAVLTELNKVQVVNLLKESFEYFINKAVQQYVNKMYNQSEMNQQKIDDLNFLKKSYSWTNPVDLNKLILPDNYLHLYACNIYYNEDNCSNNISYPVKSLTSDKKSAIINNYYLRPAYNRPYFEIRTGIDISESEEIRDTKIAYLTIFNNSKKLIKSIDIDYLSTPKKIKLPVEFIDFYAESFGSSDEVEFNDYIAYEIINETVKLILENSGDINRLQSEMTVNQTIPNLNVQK